MPESLAAVANRVVPMAQACRLAGFSVPPVRGSGVKVHCPFGEYAHPDGGREPAMRIYSDHAWCFACSEYFSPVKLAAQLWDVTEEQAAMRLLDAVGYKPASYAQLWQAVARPPVPEPGVLVAALRNYCGGVCREWPSLQLDERVSEYLSRCLAFLVQVDSEQKARQWLSMSKDVMATVLADSGLREGIRGGRTSERS